ncbi:hypothetical protein UACE39S_06122 [Ureibacillus acetophenoni]
MHSTRLYAKVRNDKLTAEYKKLGFIGLIKESIQDLKDSTGENLNQQTKMVIQLQMGLVGNHLKKKFLIVKNLMLVYFAENSLQHRSI